MRYRYVHFLAAAFLLVGMGIQFVVSYRQARHHVQEKINLEMKLAQEKLRFELYDAYDAVDQLKESVYVEESCKLEAGETLVLYTDGVTEARNSERKMMGMDYWSQIVARGGDLLKAVQGYIGKTEPTDDITLMTIHIKK